MQLGQILMDKKWISSNELEDTIYLQRQESKRLGELLIQQGYIVDEQLDQALKEQYWRKNGFWVID